MKRQKSFKVIYKFDSVDVIDWQERLGSVHDYLFRKVMNIEMQKYGKNIKTV